MLNPIESIPLVIFKGVSGSPAPTSGSSLVQNFFIVHLYTTDIENKSFFTKINGTDSV